MTCSMVYEFFLFWSHWIFFSFEILLFQFLIFYTLILLYTSKNIYYSLLYLTFLFFIFGIYLAFWQLDIYTGFLWLLELTVIFVFLLVLFYLNFKGYGSIIDNNEYGLYKFSIIFLYIFINFIFITDIEYLILNEFNVFIYWENFYEAFLNHNMNDFSVFLLSYYDFNSLELIIVGIILFIGSIICVNLYKINKDLSINNVNTFFSFFNLFKDSITFNFLRKQNLFLQNLTLPSTKILTKK